VTTLTEPDPTGDRRCWPCAVANSAVGLVVAWVPLVAAVVAGRPDLYVGTAIWGTLVTAYAGYRVVALGYLPYAESIAKRTGLHQRVGRGRKDDRR
jgi:hypothetical protein